MDQTIKYTDAYQELQTIVSALEDGDVNVDDLSEKVKRASFLINICKNKLSTTDEDVNEILKEMSAKTPDTEA